MDVGSEELRGSESNRAPEGDAEDDSGVPRVGSDLDLLGTIAEGWLADATTAEEPSIESSASATAPVEDSRSVLFFETRDLWFSGN